MNSKLKYDHYEQQGRDEQKSLQIFELKQLAEIESEYKNKCRDAIREYKNWHRIQRNKTDVIEILYGNLEGIMLRRYAEEAIKVYWVIREDFRCSFKSYIQKHCSK